MSLHPRNVLSLGVWLADGGTDWAKDWIILAYAWGGKVMASRLTFDMGRAGQPKLVGVVTTAVGAGALSTRHPVFSIAFAPEPVGGAIIMAYAAQLRTTVAVFDQAGQLLSTEAFENDLIEVVSGPNPPPGPRSSDMCNPSTCQ